MRGMTYFWIAASEWQATERCGISKFNATAMATQVVRANARFYAMLSVHLFGLNVRSHTSTQDAQRDRTLHPARNGPHLE